MLIKVNKIIHSSISPSTSLSILYTTCYYVNVIDEYIICVDTLLMGVIVVVY